MRWVSLGAILVLISMLLGGLATAGPGTSNGADEARVDAAMRAVSDRIHEAYGKGTLTDVKAVLEEEGFHEVKFAESRSRVSAPSLLGENSPASYGSDLADSWISYYWNTNLRRYVAVAYWDWRDGEWDYDNGAVDTVSMHFVDESGTRAKDIRWGSGSGQITIQANRVNGYRPTCRQNAWRYKYDISGGGIIFNFQDYTHWSSLYMCGDSGLISAWFSRPPGRPFYAIFSYRHTWDGGEFRDASIGADSDGKLSLQVSYSRDPQNWQSEDMALYE